MMGFGQHGTGTGHAFARRGIVVNCRSVAWGLSGFQRYTVEICRHLSDRIDPVAPRRPLQGVIGHAWEQTVLPAMLSDAPPQGVAWPAGGELAPSLPLTS